MLFHLFDSRTKINHGKLCCHCIYCKAVDQLLISILHVEGNQPLIMRVSYYTANPFDIERSLLSYTTSQLSFRHASFKDRMRASIIVECVYRFSFALNCLKKEHWFPFWRWHYFPFKSCLTKTLFEGLQCSRVNSRFWSNSGLISRYDICFKATLINYINNLQVFMHILTREILNHTINCRFNWLLNISSED